MPKYGALYVVRRDLVPSLKSICKNSGILTGPHAVNYHARRPLFISDDAFAIYADMEDGKLRDFLEACGATVKSEAWYKSADKKVNIPTARIQGAKYMLFPKPRKVGTIEAEGIRLTDLESTLGYLREWDPTNTYGIKALEKLASGKRVITARDIIEELDPQPEVLVLG